MFQPAAGEALHASVRRRRSSVRRSPPQAELHTPQPAAGGELRTPTARRRRSSARLSPPQAEGAPHAHSPPPPAGSARLSRRRFPRRSPPQAALRLRCGPPQAGLSALEPAAGEALRAHRRAAGDALASQPATARHSALQARWRDASTRPPQVKIDLHLPARQRRHSERTARADVPSVKHLSDEIRGPSAAVVAMAVAMAVRMHIMRGGEQTATHATGTCALSVPLLRRPSP